MKSRFTIAQITISSTTPMLFLCCFFLFSILPSSTLIAQEDPIADLYLAAPDSIVCGGEDEKEVTRRLPRFAFCVDNEEEACAKYIKGLSELFARDYACKELNNCPPSAPCKVGVRFPQGHNGQNTKPKPEQDDSGKWVFKSRRKKVRVFCECAGFADPNNPVELSETPISKPEQTIVSGTFQVFPNPAKDYLNIQLNTNLELRDQKILISDISGRQLQYLQLNSGNYQHQLDISTLAPGMYFLSLYEGDLRIETLRFLIER